MPSGCPIVWLSKMQPLISLSTTESEGIGISIAICEVIAVKNLLSELQSRNLPIPNTAPRVIFKAFEDNKSCINSAINHKTRAHTKHLVFRLHHFRSRVVNKNIHIENISTKEKVTDIFTKQLPRYQFEKLRNQLMSWVYDLTSRGSKKGSSS